MAWEAESLWLRLSPLLPDLGIEVLARADSTNTVVLQRLRGGAPGLAAQEGGARLPGRRSGDAQPCLVVAEHQTAGRGRMGRSWKSAPGASLTFTLALPLAPPNWSGLSLAVGVAIAEALDPQPDPPEAAGTEPAAPPQVRLKWPNDLWFDERKLAGILVETLQVGAQRMAVIGVGLNVLPIDLGSLSSGYACVNEFDPEASVPGLLHRIVPPLVAALREFEREGFGAFRVRYARRDLLLGRTVRGGAVEGVALGVDTDGALHVLTDSGEQLITSSEVSVRTSPWDQTTLSGPAC